jgi:hypothetical protein
MPATVIRIAITHAKTGRSMKKSAMRGYRLDELLAGGVAPADRAPADAEAPLPGVAAAAAELPPPARAPVRVGAEFPPVPGAAVGAGAELPLLPGAPLGYAGALAPFGAPPSGGADEVIFTIVPGRAFAKFDTTSRSPSASPLVTTQFPPLAISEVTRF